MSTPFDSKLPARARPPRRPGPGRATSAARRTPLPERVAQAERGAREATAAAYRSAPSAPSAPPLAIGALYRALAGLIGPRRAYEFIVKLLNSEHEAAQARLALWAESMRKNAELDQEASVRAQRASRHAHEVYHQRLRVAATTLRGQAQAVVSQRAQRARALLRAQAAAPVAARVLPEPAALDRLEALSLHWAPTVPLHWASPRPAAPEDLF